MRISDWSSDVCSSDLVPAGARLKRLRPDAGSHGLICATMRSSRACTPSRSFPCASRTGGAIRTDHVVHIVRSEEHTSELQSLMRISYAVFCLKKKRHILYILFIFYNKIHASNR